MKACKLLQCFGNQKVLGKNWRELYFLKSDVRVANEKLHFTICAKIVL